MKAIMLPTAGAGDWQALLAEPEKHWKVGRSAHSLAHCWEQANGLPTNVRNVFQSSERFRQFDLLIAIPELQVALPGGNCPSQTDLWLLGRVHDGLVSVAVEGKVSESFGPTLGEWQKAASPGKVERLDSLMGTLHLKSPLDPTIRYQLLHRTASAILMAQRFHAKHAMMLVHSFSQSNEGIEDYRAFAVALGGAVSSDGMIEIPGHDVPTLTLGWVKDVVPVVSQTTPTLASAL